MAPPQQAAAEEPPQKAIATSSFQEGPISSAVEEATVPATPGRAESVEGEGEAELCLTGQIVDGQILHVNSDKVGVCAVTTGRFALCARTVVCLLPYPAETHCHG